MNPAGPVAAQAGAAVATLVLSAGLTEPARRFALRHGLTDRPGQHKAHRQPTPYLGGLVIALATMAPIVILPRHLDPTLRNLLLAALVVMLLGLVDDVRGLSAQWRLAVEAVLAVALVASGIRLGLAGAWWLDALLTVCWTVAVTNSCNLLDNADGALATVALATAGPLAAILYIGGQPQFGLLVICLAAACAGFLLHNAPPARIFMGDSGSLFIGLVIAASVTRIQPSQGGYAHPAVLLLAVFVAAVDTGLVVLSRRLSGRSIGQGGTDHVAHRLRRVGLGANVLLAVLLLGASVSGLLAALVSVGLLPGAGTLLVAGTVGAALIALFLRIPGYPTNDGTRPAPQ